MISTELPTACAIWSDGQAGKGEPFDRDTAKPGVLTSGHVATDNTDVSGAINAANDVDWYSVWLETDHQYLIMLEGGARLTGVREWPLANLDIFDHPKGGNARAESASKCAFATYHAADGIHFIGIEGTATGSYSLTVLDTRSLASRGRRWNHLRRRRLHFSGNPLSSRLAGPRRPWYTQARTETPCGSGTTVPAHWHDYDGVRIGDNSETLDHNLADYFRHPVTGVNAVLTHAALGILPQPQSQRCNQQTQRDQDRYPRAKLRPGLPPRRKRHGPGNLRSELRRPESDLHWERPELSEAVELTVTGPGQGN